MAGKGRAPCRDLFLVGYVFISRTKKTQEVSSHQRWQPRIMAFLPYFFCFPWMVVLGGWGGGVLCPPNLSAVNPHTAEPRYRMGEFEPCAGLYPWQEFGVTHTPDTKNNAVSPPCFRLDYSPSWIK